MNSKDYEKVLEQYKNIQSILKSLEKDSAEKSLKYDNFREILRNHYVHNMKLQDYEKANSMASHFIDEYKSSLKNIQDIEKRESRIFNVTSNAALLTTIGAAISASMAPVLVGPAAVIAAATAIGGFISKLTLDNEAKEEANSLIESINKVGLESAEKESLTSQASGTP